MKWLIFDSFFNRFVQPATHNADGLVTFPADFSHNHLFYGLSSETA